MMAKSMLIIDLMNESPSKRFSIYQHMATTIVDLTRENGGCLPQDLLQHGFTKEETVELWHMAHAMAEVELKHMESNAVPNFKREKHHV